MAALSIEAVAKFYGATTALSDVSFTVESGEFVTLLGPSGSGKTTLLMIVAGFAEADRGRILVDGADVTGLPPEARNFGMVFQGYALFPHLTVRDNIAFPLNVRRRPRAEIDERVAAAIRLVQLDGLEERKPRALSGGQQQRVALARALVFQPRLLLLDEPLGALDKNLRGDMQRELRDLHARTGVTFIHVTHDQEEALAMSDRIVVLNKGAIEQLGPPRELYNRPCSAFVAGFLGANNILRGTLGPPSAGGVTVECLGATLQAPAAPAGARSGDAVLVTVRPESLTLMRADEPASSNRVAGEVRSTMFHGNRETVLVGFADGSVVEANVPPGSGWRAGQQAVAVWPAEATHLLSAT